MQSADLLLVNFLTTGKKISKIDANYSEQRREQSGANHAKEQMSCDKCKFNLPAENLCHIVEGSVIMSKEYQNFFLRGDTECCLEIFSGTMSPRGMKN